VLYSFPTWSWPRSALKGIRTRRGTSKLPKRNGKPRTIGAKGESLSDEAQELLIEAAKDPHGSVLWVPTKTSGDIQTNGQSFGNREDPREQAEWEAALRELDHRGFLHQGHGGGTSA